MRNYIRRRSVLAAPAPLTASAHLRLPPCPCADPNRCARGFVGNTIGQANAVSDKPLDLRYCDFRGADLRTKTLSGGGVWGGGGGGAILISRWVLRCWVGAQGVRCVDCQAPGPEDLALL